MIFQTLDQPILSKNAVEELVEIVNDPESEEPPTLEILNDIC